MKYYIRPLFNKFQKELVAFSNTNYGRNYIARFGGKELLDKYPVIKVTPDSIHQQLDNSHYRAVFYPKSPYVKLLSEVLTMMDIAFENNKRIIDPKLQPLVIPHFMYETTKLVGQLPQVLMASGDPIYPDANPETTTVDGSVFANLDGVTWATLIASGGSSASDSSATERVMGWNEYLTTNWDRLFRGIFLFDTSSIPDTATITSATLSLYKSAGDDSSDKNPSACVYSSSPASDTGLVAGDFDSLGSTALSNTVGYDSFSDVAYTDLTLNATGLAAISKTGITKFGIRDSVYDAGATEPTQNTNMYMNVYAADNGTNKPKLVVNYSEGGETATIGTYRNLTGVGI